MSTVDPNGLSARTVSAAPSCGRRSEPKIGLMVGWEQTFTRYEYDEWRVPIT